MRYQYLSLICSGRRIDCKKAMNWAESKQGTQSWHGAPEGDRNARYRKGVVEDGVGDCVIVCWFAAAAEPGFGSVRLPGNPVQGAVYRRRTLQRPPSQIARVAAAVARGPGGH